MRRLGQFIPVLLVALILIVYRNDTSYTTTPFPGGAQQALLLTAHPDDECMFFSPTILALVQTVTLYSLCLSVGDADGLGNTREKELRKSLEVLGIPAKRSRVVNHPLLQDNFTREWHPNIIAEVVNPFIISNNITLILTFDEHGISQHPNHISLPNGVSHLLSSPFAPSAQLFTLRTVPLLHKYIGPTSNPLTKLWLWLPWTSRDDHIYIAGFRGYLTALRAMYQHQSQLVWFRWLYVLFSRYMWVNEWVEVPIHAHA